MGAQPPEGEEDLYARWHSDDGAANACVLSNVLNKRSERVLACFYVVLMLLASSLLLLPLLAGC